MVLALNFKGLMAPVFTPFSRTTGEVDVSVISPYASFLLERGVEGFLVNGTVGEGVCMSVQERRTVLEAWLEVTKKNTSVHVMVQIGGVALRDVQELARHAEKNGADSILCLPDLFHRPKNVDELIHYLTLVGQAAPNTPLLYYHYPAHTGVTLDMAEFLTKAAATNVPTLAGIKFTHNNLEEGSRCLRVNDGKFSVLLGNDYLISAGFFEGFDSLIATTLNMLTRDIVDIRSEVTHMNTKGARTLQLKMNNIIDTITKHGKWVPTMKEAMYIMTGLDMGAAREPQGRLTDVQVTQMRSELTQLRTPQL